VAQYNTPPMSSPTSGRQRRTRSGAALTGNSAGTAFMVDLFKRIPSDYQSASYLGGLLTASCAAVLTVLVLLEFQAYLTVSYQSAIVFPGNTLQNGVNTPYQPFVSIRFNVTFPHLPCQYMSAELFDVYGRHSITNYTAGQPDDTVGEEPDDIVSMEIFKWRVVDNGKKRAGVMQEHGDDETSGEPVHEELPYHHAAHQYRDVVPLTSLTFDTFVESKDVVMVDFYAPWCIWCKRLAPVWENFAHEVGAKDYADFVGVAKVDCTTEVDICRRRRIAGYPSIFLYRDRNPHSHTPYNGDRTTSAFVSFIEGLGVETDHKREVAELLDDIQGELHAETNVIKKAAFKDRDTIVDAGINHPLKALTAPGGILGGNEKDSALTGIMRALDTAGGSRGASFRVFNGKGGGAIRIISVRRIPTDSKRENEIIQAQKPLEFHTAKKQQELGGADEKVVEDGQESITIKVLPSARQKFNEKVVKEMATIITPDPDATVPKPIVATKKKPESKDDVDDAKDTISENVREGLKAAAKDDKDAPPVPKPNRRRSLLQIDANLNGEESEKEKGRIADSALESLSELLIQTTNKKKKIELWKKIFPPLPEDQKKKNDSTCWWFTRRYRGSK